MKQFLFKLSLLASVMILAVYLVHPFLSGAAFNSNNLMDDAVFDNANSMSAAGIDAWLNYNFPTSCISTNNGFSSPDPIGYNPSQGFLYGGNVSAGTVISHAAQAYSINPQVLIATLQKESSVVSGDASYHCDYINTSMGYDCPDSGSCPQNPATESGFSKQIIHAAWLLKFGRMRSEGNTGWAIIKPGWDNSDDLGTFYSGPMTQGTFKRSASSAATYYDGYTTIDGVATHMDTGATAAFYWYTPHFHGNQNFNTIFTNWFGSVYTPSYAWQLSGQYAYTDQTKTTPIGLNNLTPGQRVYIGFTAVNTGNQTWTNSGPNPVNVGTTRPIARSSAFFDSTWLGPNRPAAMKEASVAPGQSGTFEFWIKAPTVQQTTNLNFNEYFSLVKEGVTWFPDIGLYYGISVQPARYSWQLTGQYAFTDQTKSTPTGLGNMSPGQRVYVGVTAKNTGNMTWSNTGPNPVFLATTHGLNRSSAFSSYGWQNNNRAAKMQEATVAPGQTGTFEFWMTAPSSLGGNFHEYFNLVSEGRAWMDDLGMNFSGSLVNPIYTWTLAYQYAYTDQTKTTPTGLNNMSPGQTALVGIKVNNTSNVTWYQGSSYPLNLGTSRPLSRNSPFYTAGWPGYSRPSHMLESSVAPGQQATFEFTITAPATRGTYLEFFTPVAEGITWLPDIGLNFNIIVR